MNASGKTSFLIFSPYYPPHIGGLESHADEFNKHLSQRGVDIIVFTPHIPVSAPERETIHNHVEVIRFPAFELIHNYPVPKLWSPKFWILWRELFRSDTDIIISRTRFFLTSLMALIYAKTRGKKWIHIEHGSDFVQLSSAFKTFLAKLYDHIFGRLVFRYSDKNISISKAVQNFVGKFDKRMSPVIYRGLETRAIDAIAPDTEVRARHHGKVILTFIGRLYKWKGVADSITAIRSLPEEIKNKIVFLIVGDGEDFSSLKKLSQSEKCIEMLGSLPTKHAIAILKSSDIYLHSAHPGGGLSTSLLEAIYCGCTVVATPHEGANEVIRNGENGILMEDSSPISVKVAIASLLANSSHNDVSLKNQARQTITEKFSWKKSIDEYVDIFKAL
ncbi:MAG: glycosyltransferase family 4 protein [Candidatus Moraniibacteriota bacterium]|nr:MAG: glycosyltransferase family 4 protein [Candidatus Moranbacteria bacterium]